jgi:tripartite-type tricarboxylate transporter receptor subunit TctC
MNRRRLFGSAFVFDVPVWYGVVAPAGTPAAVVQRLNTNAVLKESGVAERLDAIGAVPIGGTPAQMGEFMKAQSAKWARVIKEANVRLD